MSVAMPPAWSSPQGGLLQPLLPTQAPFRTPTAPYTSAIPTVIPREASEVLMRLDEAVGINPGAYMAPNWVYPCGPGGASQCFTEVASTGMAFGASTVAQSARAVDAVTRGLLSGLQPILSASETSLFTDGEEGVRSTSTLAF